MKKRFGMMIAAAAAAIALFISGCATTPSPRRSDGKAHELVILHVNDTHGAVLATKDGIGGFVSMATFIKQVRAQNKNVLVLHAGDVNTGSALSNMFNAEPDIMSFNKMGFDAIVLGNHEFDGTLAKLERQIKIAEFPWLSANIKRGGHYLVKPYIIKDYDGFRVAVIGLTTLRTLVIASPDKSLTFIDEIEAAIKKQAKNTEKVLNSLQIIPGFESKVAHYSRVSTAFSLLDSKEPSKFRLNTIRGVNDPTEGLVLGTYWNKQGISENIHANDTATFISCFTFNHDSLNQFRLYGKEDKQEATGVSLVFNKEFFSNQADALEFIAGPSTDLSSKSEQINLNETGKMENDNWEWKQNRRTPIKGGAKNSYAADGLATL